MRFYTITILPAILVPVFAAVHTVVIKNFRFIPQVVDINPGDEVTWINNDNTGHTATANAGSFDSGLIAPGMSFSHTFTTAATLPYHCSIHPFMLGRIAITVNSTSSAVVTTATASATATTATATTTTTATATTTTATATTTTATATATPTTTTKPSSGNTLDTPIKVILLIGGGVAAIAQFL
ncbi:hypothetical protein KI688_012997 [Linnemannia hyalina]|uniref:Blue (type 1) copper domain-containing protein n=1 Tax=Linnemannia hyalina TaxID=64524 RepID=A0A9P7XTI9_9FUNG|nr:hypothetical protein KI688_012997 [Linnemannia hyalina]